MNDSTTGESTRGESTRGESTRGESTRGESTRGESTRGESIQEGARPADGPLYRPTQDRIISGTAIGLAHKLGLPPLLVRAVFVLLFFSGTGLPLYIVCWLLIPGEGETESIGQRWLAKMSGSQAWLGVVLVVLAVAILASALPFMDGGIVIPTVLLVVGVLLYRGEFRPIAGPPTPAVAGLTTKTHPTPTPPRRPPTPPSPLGQITIGATIIALGALALIDRASPLVTAFPRHYFALAVTVMGLGVLVGTRYGRARWIIPFGLLLIPVSVAAGFVEFSREAAVRVIRPAAISELEQIYDLPVGQLTIDLRALAWSGETVEVVSEVGVGRIDLLLPAGVGVEAETEVGIGASNGPIDDRGGFGVENDYSSPGTGAGTVVARLEVGIGEITIVSEGLPGDSSDEVITVIAFGPEDLEPRYEVTGDGEIAIDLSALELTEDVFLQLAAEDGAINVMLPQETLYNIEAASEAGDLNVLGSVDDSGGSINSSVTGAGPTLHITASTDQGNILIGIGGKS